MLRPVCQQLTPILHQPISKYYAASTNLSLSSLPSFLALCSANSAWRSLPLAKLLNSTDLDGSVGYFLWQKVISLLTDCKYLRVISSFMMWATLLVHIFSRADRSWMPTMVTPIGHGELPIASLMQWSMADKQSRLTQQFTTFKRALLTSSGRAWILQEFTILLMEIYRDKEVYRKKINKETVHRNGNA